MNSQDEIIKNFQTFIEIAFLKYGGSPFPITTDHLKSLISAPTNSFPFYSSRLNAGDVFEDLQTRYSLCLAPIED